jgi:hypothetical protein
VLPVVSSCKRPLMVVVELLLIVKKKKKWWGIILRIDVFGSPDQKGHVSWDDNQSEVGEVSRFLGP